jgi:hypothetical protein
MMVASLLILGLLACNSVCKTSKSEPEWVEQALLGEGNVFSDSHFDSVDEIQVYSHNSKRNVVPLKDEHISQIVKLLRDNSNTLRQQTEISGEFMRSSQVSPCMCLLFELSFKQGNDILLRAVVHGHYGIEIEQVSQKHFGKKTSLVHAFENSKLREYLRNLIGK